MGISEYLKSVECGYMSKDRARKVFGIDEYYQILSPSGSNYDYPGISDFMDLKVSDISIYNDWASSANTYRDQNKVKCTYCGRKNDSEDETCASCGAIL